MSAFAGADETIHSIPEFVKTGLSSTHLYRMHHILRQAIGFQTYIDKL